MTKKIIYFIIILIICGITGYIEKIRVENIESLYEKQIDSLCVQGIVTEVDTILQIDSIYYEHTTYDTIIDTILKDTIFNINHYIPYTPEKIISFYDSSNVFFNLHGKAHYPSGKVDLVYLKKDYDYNLNVPVIKLISQNSMHVAIGYYREELFYETSYNCGKYEVGILGNKNGSFGIKVGMKIF